MPKKRPASLTKFGFHASHFPPKALFFTQNCRFGSRRVLHLLICAFIIGISVASKANTAKASIVDVDQITAVIRQSDLPNTVKSALIKAINDSPEEKRWAGSKDIFHFALVVRPIPAGSQRKFATPLVLSAAHILAIQELLTHKAILDRYAEDGLTDAVALRKVLVSCRGELDVVGRVKGVVHKSQSQGDVVVAYVLCESSHLHAHLRGEKAQRMVREAYREEMHEQLRQQMKSRNWKQGIVLWDHLRSRKLTSANLYLDAARCLTELKRPREGLAVLKDAFEQYGSKASADWLEKCGDQALVMGSEGEDLARIAFERASELLRSTLSDGKR